MSFSAEQSIIIYTDGACSGNPGPGGWASIILDREQIVTELGGYEVGTTNNRMEISSAIYALEFVVDSPDSIILFTDSTYLIRGITQWVFGWQKRGWESTNGGTIANQDLWQALIELTRARKKHGSITWEYVRGHSGVPGNERCDQIAVAYSQGGHPTLYTGPHSGYGFDLTAMPKKEPLPEIKFEGGKTKKAAHSYLSFVNGVVTRHATWADCERVVKGRPGAKFKKAMSPQEESEILRAWGLDPSKIKL